ncbi:MAG TPA: cytochrome c oxidase accessory protein CcoG [Burkholderiaceae bacterium]|nr:cytochrome c oxidase accessory protein CcoG [Burkholderiaceae bacterium]
MSADARLNLPAAEPQLETLYESESKVYPRAVTGWFAGWRWTMVWITQLVFYSLPWLQWNGRPLMLFDLDARRFHVFGLVLYPQDFIYLTALLVIAALSLFFFTAVAGRLWCGYACPQTVYTEIFMWVERRIEGDRQARMRLDAAPWSARKVARKAAKHAAWIAIGGYTGFTFVGYFTPIRALAHEIAALAVSPWETFWMLFYGAATYGNAGWMREQVCKYMCPYARFQSAMIDDDSLIITYDAGRGDPRGSRKRNADPRALGLGDCIDCTLCVQVCPTGIDIRNGLQNECIGCAACVDVCDKVMDKMGSPRGLIRYATQNGVAKRWTRAQMLRRVLRPRVLVYFALLATLGIGFVASIAWRSPFRVDVIKERNMLARTDDDGRIENVYRLQVLNATSDAQQFRVEVSGMPGLEVVPRPPIAVAPEAIETAIVHVTLPPEAAQPWRGRSVPIRFRVRSAAGGVVDERSTFLVPREE